MISKTRLFTAFAIYIFHCNYSAAQYAQPDTANLLSIQQITIRDTRLVDYLKDYISRNKSTNQLFADGLGFVTINNPDFKIASGRPLNMNGESVSTRDLSSLTLSIKAYPLNPKPWAEGLYGNFYPPYYSVIDDKIVLIYEENIMAMYGRQQANDMRTDRFYTKESKEKLTKLIKRKAIIDLPDESVFEEHLHMKDYVLTMGMVRKSRKNPEDAYIIYEFINFKADETIYYDPEVYKWVKVEKE